MVIVSVVATVLYVALVLYFISMWVRFVLDWVRALQPRWRPHGPMLVVAEVVFTITDPPIKLVRRVIPPLQLGALRLDFAWTIVLIVVIILMSVVAAFR